MDNIGKSGHRNPQSYLGGWIGILRLEHWVVYNSAAKIETISADQQQSKFNGNRPRETP